MLTGFPRTRWPRLRFSESYAVRISVKISRICEFRVIMGIMTGLLGCCSSSTLGSRANDYVKTLATLGFWLHHSPCSLGCWTNNTLAARSLSPIITLVRQKKARFYSKMHGSTEKSPVRQKNARFDRKMPSPECISWHCHYQTSPPPPSSEKYFFPIFFPYFFKNQ